MKHIIISLVTLTVAVSACGVVYAHGQAQLLVSPGLTPSSPFYFLDRLGEFIEEFFTFSVEGKVRLQVEFAAERVAEIKLTLETQGAQSEALGVALERLKENAVKAAEIFDDEKNEGNDITDLIKEISEGFDEQDELLEEIFAEHKEVLEVRGEELKTKIEEVDDGAEDVNELLEDLGDLEDEMNILDVKSIEKEIDSLEVDLPEPMVVTISYENSVFNPASVKVKVGEVVKFINKGNSAIVVASDPHPVHTSHPALNSGKLDLGGVYEFKATEKKIIHYHNHFNAGAGGEIVVE